MTGILQVCSTSNSVGDRNKKPYKSEKLILTLKYLSAKSNILSMVKMRGRIVPLGTFAKCSGRKEILGQPLLSVCKGISCRRGWKCSGLCAFTFLCTGSTEMAPSQSIWVGLSAWVSLAILSATSRVISAKNLIHGLFYIDVDVFRSCQEDQALQYIFWPKF